MMVGLLESKEMAGCGKLLHMTCRNYPRQGEALKIDPWYGGKLNEK